MKGAIFAINSYSAFLEILLTAVLQYSSTTFLEIEL